MKNILMSSILAFGISISAFGFVSKPAQQPTPYPVLNELPLTATNAVLFAEAGWQVGWGIQYDVTPATVSNLFYVGYGYGAADGMVSLYNIPNANWQGYELYNNLPWGSFPYPLVTPNQQSYYDLANTYLKLALTYWQIPAAWQEFSYAAGYYWGVGDAIAYSTPN